MCGPRALGVLLAGLGSALVALGGFLRWWIPEEADGWLPLGAGAALLLAAGLLLWRPRSPDPQTAK